MDATLFVGRDGALSAVCRGLSSELNILVTGDRGAGRTSFLRYLQFRSRSGHPDLTGDFPMTYVRVEGITDGVKLLRRIVQMVTDEPDVSDEPDALLKMLAEYRTEDVKYTERRWQAESANSQALKEARLFPVIILDDVTASAGHALFGQYRDEVWATGFLWVVSVRESDRGGLLTPPADAFFEKVVQLDPLSKEESLELINCRGGTDLGPIGETLVGAVRGNPRDLVGALRSMLQDPDSFDANANAVGARDDAIYALGRSASMLAAELKSRGAVSASDKELLAALGWTRPRAVQVFNELAEKGLVTSSEVASGPGRPRRLFELTAPAEWMRAQMNRGDEG